MSVRIPWTIDEAVIMLDALLAARENRISRKEAIQLVSDKLRKLAVKNGMQIDEIYRNTNGISLQMSAMEYVLTNGTTGLNKPTKLFQSVVKQYRTDKVAFSQKVNEINALIDERNFIEKRFKDWLAKRMSPTQINDLMTCYPEIEKHCLKSKVLRKPLFETTNLATVKMVEKAIAENVLFQLFHRRQMKAILSAIQYYMTFLKTLVETPIAANTSTPNSHIVAKENEHSHSGNLPQEVKTVCEADNTDSYKCILKEHFAKGFRIDSILDMKKFRRCYEMLTGNILTEEDTVIRSVVQKCGISHEGKIFLPETMLNDYLRENLFRFITQLFDSGKKCIYFEALFREFSEAFLDSHIYDASMLKSYLECYNNGSYCVGESFLFKEANTVLDSVDEVRICLIEHSGPMSTEQLRQELVHLPWEIVTTALNANQEFIYNGKKEYFHADTIDLSDKELDDIAELIHASIQTHRYISKTELLSAIKVKYPDIYESYPAVSDLGWRDALKYKLGSRFSFKGNIISASGESLSMSDVFGDLARTSERLTLDELQRFAEEMGSQIYLKTVYDNALRINETIFVSKARACFQVNDTDSVIDRFCTGSYIPIKAVQEFSIFPDAGSPWTSYLLECYVAYYSIKYTLLHSGYNQYSAVGAIVKKSAGYSSFDDLMVDLVADSDIQLKKPDALELLVQEGYLARRSYANVEKVLIRAREKRNGKGRS